MSAEPFPVEPGSPRLEAALDPELMREVFQKHLRPLGKKAYRIRECQVYHVRYERGVRCVQYALNLEESDTGHERSQWVSGVTYAEGRTRQVWKELRRSERVRRIAGIPSALAAPLRWLRQEPRRSEPGRKVPDVSPPFAPFSYAPELDMLVQVFPYDRRLPALPLLMAGPPPELPLLACFGPGDWRLEAWDADTIRYLAYSRATLRLTARAREAATGRTEERRFYAKVYHNQKKGERTYQALQALWEKAGAGGAGFSVGRPITYLSDLRTLVQEEVPGTTLTDVLFLREDEATTIPIVRKAARALAVLHLDHVPTPRQRGLEKEVSLLERAGKLLQGACPHLGPEIEETVGAVIAGLEEVPLAPTHCDLGPDHILVDGDRLALIDLDAFAEADPVLDVAHALSVFAAMRLLSFLPDGRARTAARAFAEEYFAHVPEAWRGRLPFHYAGALLKRAAGLLNKSQVPDWPEKVEVFLKEAKDSLAGRV